MAEECTTTSAVIASSSSSPTPHSWWDHHPTKSLSSWSTSNAANSTNSWHHHHHHQNPNSNSSNNNNICDQDDVLSISTSLTNASNHSVLTVDESSAGGCGGSRQLLDQQDVPPDHPSMDLMNIGEHGSDNHLWSQVLSSVESIGNSGPDVGENLFEAISSKTNSLSAGISYEPACDYLKKIDGNWEFPAANSSVFNNFIKNLNGYNDASTTDIDDHDHQGSIESERLTRLSNLVSTWSIAPPDPQVNHRFMVNPKSYDYNSLSTSNSVENFSQQQLPGFCGMATIKNPVFVSRYDNGNYHHNHHDVKMETQSLDMEAPISYYRRAFKGNNGNGYHHHSLINNNSMEADNLYGLSHSVSTSSISYNRLSKPLVDNIHASKPLNLSACKKKGLQAANSLQTRNSNGRTQGITSEGKKKRSGEEMSDNTTVLKKTKHENSTASSLKMHAPKVKLGDKIAALQQIVSPFGKTDTASVLLEAIGYINFLQEQVQVLSNPYMKLNSHKDPWGSLDRKDQNGDLKVDLRSKGLCLVPSSCTPQVYLETTGSDYWTPTYRGCLYR
ncbi:hypothetical protein PTKIN_Ptkin02bG0047100 [Pterospermum kingtungense]